jgi:hypothetical protein
MNLYNSRIERDIISLQLDVSKEEVDKIIEQEENRRKKARRIKNASNVSVTLGSSFYLDQNQKFTFELLEVGWMYGATSMTSGTLYKVYRNYKD